MKLYDLTDFLRLSATLHLQLSAEGVGPENVLRIITNRMPLKSAQERKVLLHVFKFLANAYEKQRRHVGPPAILHPLRATALLTQATGEPHFLDMLTELLHDKYEDLTPAKLGQERYGSLEVDFRSLLKDVDSVDEWYLMERLDHLALKKNESYYQYCGRLLERARRTPELVRTKLADRLDNTLDLHIDIEDSLEGVNFFELIFRIMFPPSGSGYQPGSDHPISSPLNGARRLYQLFKNAILLSLIREKRVAPDDPAARNLFDAVARASTHEAQRIALHIMGYHETRIERQRELLMEVQCYAQEGGMTRTTVPSGEHPLDGLFMMRFDHADPTIRSGHLEELYRDKGLMLQAAVSFVVIFLNFVHSPDYWVRGISDHGIEAFAGQTTGGSEPRRGTGSQRPPAKPEA